MRTVWMGSISYRSTPSRIRSSAGNVSTGTISIDGSNAAIRSPSTLQTTATRRPSSSA